MHIEYELYISNLNSQPANDSIKMQQTHSKIIDVKDLDYALEFMLSNTIKWYTDRSVTLVVDCPKV